MDHAICPHCQSARWYGCKFGCPQKQPPRGDDARSYEDWAAEQREQHRTTHEKCMRPWVAHACPGGGAA